MELKNKRALVLSGGGSRGSWEVGAIKALAEKDRTWDIVSGVSVGALNAAGIAMYPKEKHLEAALKLEKLWLEDIKGNKSIYKKWAPWILNYLFSLWKGSLYNTAPLYELMKKNFNQEGLDSSGVSLRLGTVGLKTGQYKAATEKDDNIIEWILASSSMPVMFQPVELGGEKWVDGGIRNITPLSDVLVLPGIAEIDVVLANTLEDIEFKENKFTNVINVGTRCLELAVDEIFHTDLIYVCYELKHGVKINVYAPEKHETRDPFDFDPQYIKERIEKGYRETIKKL